MLVMLLDPTGAELPTVGRGRVLATKGGLGEGVSYPGQVGGGCELPKVGWGRVSKLPG